MTYIPQIIIYHHPCTDGITAASVVYNYLNSIPNNTVQTEFIKGDYANIGDIDVLVDKFRDKDVLLVDFSFKNAVLQQLMQSANSILILDHHKTAQQELENFIVADPTSINNIEERLIEQKVIALFDMSKCGSSMTYSFFNPDKQIPPFIRYVEDIDINLLQQPNHKSFQWYSRALPFDVKVISKLIEISEETLATQFQKGDAIYAFVTNRLNELKNNVLEGDIAGVKFGWVITDYALASEMSNYMLDVMGYRIGISLYFTGTGLGVSLRSAKDLDCSIIAKNFGGGGHAQASGFNVPFADIGGFVQGLQDGGIIDYFIHEDKE